MHWDTFLARYGFAAMDELDAAILEGIRAGFFNTTLLTEMSEKLDVAARDMQARLNLDESWRSFHESLTSDTDTVVKTILSALKTNIQAVNISNLDATVRLFKQLDRPDDAAEALMYFLANKQGGLSAFDIESYGFRHNVRDADVIAGLKARYLSAQQLPSPEEVLQHMVETKGWTNIGIEVLAGLTVDQYVALFKRIGGSTLREMLEILRGMESMDLNDKRYARISDSTRRALTLIAKGSKLNAVRLTSLGFVPLADPDPGMPNSSQLSDET
jgi:hypothetical protein